MLFNSIEFVFIFLPAVVIGFLLLSRTASTKVLQGWLVASSLFYYGWWDPRYLLIIAASILFNYYIGEVIERGRRGRLMLALGVCGNLGTLGYFKYTDFFITNVNTLAGASYPLQEIVLPLGISFFTFQQIAYLVDRNRGEVQEHGLLQYALFVVFFPQLIAGPIVHHKDMMPQLSHTMGSGLKVRDLSLGVSIFAIGLFKKVVIADEMARFASPVFAAALGGSEPSLFEAWGGALAYTFQLYFDFSGYSDMAIGIGAMFGVRLPLNFNSPYKATSIIDFWRDWHMTLSAFLRDYLYIPLGGNRFGRLLRYRNLMITMVLGGLWHGAAWTFVIWGALHGLYLVVNHAWRFATRRWRSERPGAWAGHFATRWAGLWAGRLLTFLAVTVAWVFFRAESLDAALLMLNGMAGQGGVVVTAKFLPQLATVFDGAVAMSPDRAIGALTNHKIYKLLPLLLIVVWVLPNCGQVMAKENARRLYAWRPNLRWLILSVILLTASLYTMIYQQNRISEFIYFQF